MLATTSTAVEELLSSYIIRAVVDDVSHNFNWFVEASLLGLLNNLIDHCNRCVEVVDCVLWNCVYIYIILGVPS